MGSDKTGTFILRVVLGAPHHAQHQLEDPDVVIQGNRVLHLRFPVRR